MASTEVYEAHRSHLRLSSCPPRGPGGHGPGPRLPAAVAETERRAGPWPPVGRRPPALPLAAAATRGGALVAGRIGVARRQAEGALRGQRGRAGWAAVGGRRSARARGAASVVKLTLKQKTKQNQPSQTPLVRASNSLWGAVQGLGSVCLALRDTV